jgi:ADP-ribosylglycohydrolase
MIGAITGDVLGSVYEYRTTKDKNVELLHGSDRFTDDSVLTIAVAAAILESGGSPTAVDYARHLRALGRRYPDAGYGGTFFRWLNDESMGAYNSWGNGAAMRVSAVGWAFRHEADVLSQAELTAAPTHDHPEGIKGAQAAALAVFMARNGAAREEIRAAAADRFGYDMQRTVDGIRPRYHFDVSCQGSVPEAIIAFLDSTDYEDAVRNAVSLGGDADTQACIAGAVAEAFYGGVPERLARFALGRLTPELLEPTVGFAERYLPEQAAEQAREALAVTRREE